MGMKNLQIFGIIGSFGGYITSILEAANVYLQFLSLLLGVIIGVWALYDKIKKICSRSQK